MKTTITDRIEFDCSGCGGTGLTGATAYKPEASRIVITVRMTANEKNIIDARSHAKHLSLNEYIRRVLCGLLPNGYTDGKEEVEGDTKTRNLYGYTEVTSQTNGGTETRRV